MLRLLVMVKVFGASWPQLLYLNNNRSIFLPCVDEVCCVYSGLHKVAESKPWVSVGGGSEVFEGL